MKIKLLLAVFCLFSFTQIYAQRTGVSVKNRKGTVYYTDGTSEKGKLTYDKTKLSIKYADNTIKKLDINTVKKFQSIQGNKKTWYTFILKDEKAEQKELSQLLYNGEKITLYCEPIAGNSRAQLAGYAVYFVKKNNDEKAIRLKKNGKKLKEYLNDCSALAEKIGKKNYKYYDTKKIIVEYDTECK